MNLTLEKDVTVAVEINGGVFIDSSKGTLYRHIDDDEIYLYIKNLDNQNEVKIKISKTHDSNKIE